MAILYVDGSTVTEEEVDGRTIAYPLRNATNTSNLSLPSNTRVCDSGNLLFTWSGSTSSRTIRAFKHPVDSTRRLVFLGSKAIRPPSGVSLGQGIFVPEGHGITTAAGVDAITCVLCGYDSIGWGLLPVTNGTPATGLTRLSAVSSALTQSSSALQITKAGSSGYMVVGSNGNWFACDALGADVPQAFRNRMLNFPANAIAHTGTRLYVNQRTDGLGDLSTPRGRSWIGITAYNNGLVAMDYNSFSGRSEYGTVSGNNFTLLGTLSARGWQDITAYNNGLAVINSNGRYGTVSGNTFTQLGDLSGTRSSGWTGITAYNNELVVINSNNRYGTVSGDTFTQLGKSGIDNGITAYNNGLAVIGSNGSYWSLQPPSYVSWPLSFGR